jgi:signal transduction histidine kinase
MGLGMAVVKRVVDEHGGRIWFESESGAGTRFFVELPQTLAPQPPVKNPEEKE